VRIFSKFYKVSFALVILLCISSCIGRTSESFDINNAIGKENLVDALIVGSGMAGLNASMYYARQGYNVLVLEGESPGGALTRTNEIENFPGVVEKTGPELMESIREQSDSFGVEFSEDLLQEIDFSSWPYRVTTEEGVTIHAMTVIIATGSSPRELGVPGEEEYFGKGIFTCAICDGFLYKGKEVIVVGGGDSAVEEALQLINFGVEKVTVLVRGAKMRAIKHLRDRLKEEDKVVVKHHNVIEEVLGDGQGVTGARVLDKISGKSEVIPAAGILVAIGSVPNTWFLKDTVDMDIRGYLLLKGRSQQTSQKAVYAAGDVEANISHQAIIAAGMGRKASIEAVKFLTEEVGLSRKVRAKLQNSYYKGPSSRPPSLKLRRAAQDRPRDEEGDSPVKKLENLDQFKEKVFTVSDKLVIVDFYTEFCPSCKAMLPAMEMVAKEYADSVCIYKVDAGIATDIAKECKVTSVPRVLVFKSGKIVEDESKSLSKAKIKSFVEKHV